MAKKKNPRSITVAGAANGKAFSPRELMVVMTVATAHEELVHADDHNALRTAVARAPDPVPRRVRAAQQAAGGGDAGASGIGAPKSPVPAGEPEQPPTPRYVAMNWARRSARMGWAGPGAVLRRYEIAWRGGEPCWYFRWYRSPQKGNRLPGSAGWGRI